MNAQDYISSGLLEGYILGALPLNESEQVAGAMCRFPEVATEMAALEALLMRNAEEEAIAPPPMLEDRIWSAILASAPARPSVKTEPPIAQVSPTAPLASHTRVIPLGKPAGRRIAWPMAAALALLLGSLLVNLIFWNNRDADRRALASLQTQVQSMNTQVQDLSAQSENLSGSLARYQAEAGMMADPARQMVLMQTTNKEKPMAAVAYWNKAKGEVDISIQQLPPPPPGMQYQLWVISSGKPVSMGMLDNRIALSNGIQHLTHPVMDGQAFAISLEKKGGNPTPTADRIYVLGKAV